MAAFASDTLIIFTASPTGLGHIRVMNALIGGLAAGVDYVVVGISDVNAAKIHTLGSRLPIALKITEFIQNHSIFESVITKIYQKYYSTRTGSLTHELSKIKEDFPDKKIWIIVSTHFALAYPVIAVKQGLSEKFNVKILNALVVTDDSPQRVWAAEGSDIIFVPSESTEAVLRLLLPKETKTAVETVSFPVSPRLKVKLIESELELLENQLDPSSDYPLHISVPVSGAAVQLDFLSTIIKSLAYEKFIFTVIGQLTSYTQDFFEALKKIPRVQVSTGLTAHSTVRFYESAFYQASRPGVEITKPSEQTFKAILKPNEKGGVIMLITDPIGRQEYDNLNFLIRHKLLAEREVQEELEKYLVDQGKIPEEKNSEIHYQASHWRALKLPKDPARAATFIKNAKATGIFYSMLAYVPEVKRDLTSNGVEQIWNSISQMLEYRHGQKRSS